MSRPYDLVVVGGGINGAGIARDAAGRGLRVMLVEKDDLASHTSSASTKLVHGGLRYLENYEFRLVAESLREREVLLHCAPHIIWPLRFVMPHEPSMRPKWMLRAGLLLYDHIGGRMSLPKSRAIDLNTAPHRGVLQDRFKSGFEYSDCWVEDSRLVVLSAMDAEARGATVATRTECVALQRSDDSWTATLRGAAGEKTVEAKAVINTAGPFVDRLARQALGQGTPSHLRLVKGSHIIVSRRFPGEHAYIFQQPDGRIVFAIPYERDFTLIGTTDLLFEGDLDAVRISDEEIAYLCEAASRYFTSSITREEIASTYSGVRPLYEDNAASNSTVTRDYVFELDSEGGAPILSVYGGKITTFRKLAEHALEKLGKVMEVPGAPWTAHAKLPGGEFEDGDFARFLWKSSEHYDWVPPEMLLRLGRAYGTRLAEILHDKHSLADLGSCLGGNLYEAELRYLVEHEYARTAEDVLWRRSKLGLHLPADAQARVAEWMAANVTASFDFA
ncbi:glycerol-3-phosphate dehydrogenase [Qipengyuania sp. 6B39]|uniref:glycerol-3-phosphate dehydrogenase n=1 Tax=Qipengyuania proteolytica TaxID=2867239 RepID=UPI001C88F441|nr:glycerol-3-phosphate dehydrogenase [Qipengyuania proteolytica]MBX7494923.1 glycerol-3-phosphate dehydrogenase [Qipengyuania proteolytica]